MLYFLSFVFYTYIYVFYAYTLSFIYFKWSSYFSQSRCIIFHLTNSCGLSIITSGQLPAAYYLPPLQPIACCLLPTAFCRCLLAAACWLLPAGYCLLAAACWPLSATCYLLAAACWPLPAGCCLLATACWLLPAGRCLPGCCLLPATCSLLSTAMVS
jgi:hypothetical protein